MVGSGPISLSSGCCIVCSQHDKNYIPSAASKINC
jgi:hypothetical protein